LTHGVYTQATDFLYKLVKLSRGYVKNKGGVFFLKTLYSTLD